MIPDVLQLLQAVLLQQWGNVSSAKKTMPLIEQLAFDAFLFYKGSVLFLTIG
jgi:hypothetical protein